MSYTRKMRAVDDLIKRIEALPRPLLDPEPLRAIVQELADVVFNIASEQDRNKEPKK